MWRQQSPSAKVTRKAASNEWDATFQGFHIGLGENTENKINKTALRIMRSTWRRATPCSPEEALFHHLTLLEWVGGCVKELQTSHYLLPHPALPPPRWWRLLWRNLSRQTRLLSRQQRGGRGEGRGEGSGGRRRGGGASWDKG